MATMDYISGLLDELGIKYTYDDDRILTRWETDNFDDLKVSIFTNRDESWIYFLAPFSNFYEFAVEDRNELAVQMLKASWKVDGVQFVIDDEDDIMVMSESNNLKMSPEEAVTLLRNVVGGCEILYDIHP